MPKPPAAPASAESAPQSEEELQKSIAKRYDQLNALWTRAEESLRKFLVPHSVEHCFSSYVDTSDPEHMHYDVNTHESISWSKRGSTWRVCFEICNDMHPEQCFIKPVTECSVDVRLDLVKHFPALREMVIEAARKSVENLDKAISEFRDVLK